MRVVRIIGLICAVSFFLFSTTRDASAVSLKMINSFKYKDPEGLAFDPASGHLFVARGNDWIEEATVSGKRLNRFFLDRYDNIGVDIDAVHGISPLPNGNLAISSQSGGDSGVFEFTIKGNLVRQDGFLQSFDTQRPSNDADGLAYHAQRQTMLLTDDKDEKIYEYSLDGYLLGSYSTRSINRRFDSPEGITVDPLTGHIFVADADEGTERLYELQLPDKGSEGKLSLVNAFNLKKLTNSKWDDPEGLTIDPINNILYIAWDNDNRIAAFEMIYGPPGPAPGPDPGPGPNPQIPEPSTVILLGSALAALQLKKRSSS